MPPTSRNTWPLLRVQASVVRNADFLNRLQNELKRRFFEYNAQRAEYNYALMSGQVAHAGQDNYPSVRSSVEDAW